MQLSNISSKIFEIIWFLDLKSLKIFSRDLYHMPSEIFINHLDKIFWLGVGGAGFSFWVIRMNYSHLTIRRVPCTDCTASQGSTDQNRLVPDQFSGYLKPDRDQQKSNLQTGPSKIWKSRTGPGPTKFDQFGPVKIFFEPVKLQNFLVFDLK